MADVLELSIAPIDSISDVEHALRRVRDLSHRYQSELGALEMQLAEVRQSHETRMKAVADERDRILHEIESYCAKQRESLTGGRRKTIALVGGVIRWFNRSVSRRKSPPEIMIDRIRRAGLAEELLITQVKVRIDFAKLQRRPDLWTEIGVDFVTMEFFQVTPDDTHVAFNRRRGENVFRVVPKK